MNERLACQGTDTAQDMTKAALRRPPIGGARGIRTPDLLIANETRYQLRHSPRDTDESNREQQALYWLAARR